MSVTITTSSPIQALVRGVLVGLGVLAFMWGVGLRPDGKFTLILVPTIAVPMAFYFYDRSSTGRLRVQHPQILMPNVQWNFTEVGSDNVVDFISMVTERQPAATNWTPDEKLPVRGPLEIELSQYHRDESWDSILTLDAVQGFEWTHALLLHEIHKRLNEEGQLQDAVFFEGLARTGEKRYRLFLGS